jgi:hypothetical protein
MLVQHSPALAAGALRFGLTGPPAGESALSATDWHHSAEPRGAVSNEIDDLRLNVRRWFMKRF